MQMVWKYHKTVDKELKIRTSNFEDLRKKTEQLVSEQVTFAVPQISVTID